MKRFYITSIIVAALAGMPDVVWAEDCEWADIQYATTSGQVWQRAQHWQPQRIPLADDKVCIPHDKMVIIAVGVCVGGSREWQDCDLDGGLSCPGGTCNTSISKDVVAKVIGIEGGEQLNLHLNPRTTLTLYGDDDPEHPFHSFVDGDVEMFCGAELVIAGDLTIEGSAAIHGKEVGGGFCSTWNLPPPLIKSAVGTNFTLTLEDTLVLDEEMVIDVSLDNNAYVIANRGELTLQGGQKSGSGCWLARKDYTVDPTLVIDAPIELEGASWYLGAQGSGEEWRIEDPGSVRVEDDAAFSNWTGLIQMSADGAIELNRPSATTWDFLLTSGTLKVIEDFDTSGDLEMTGGKIIVTAGKTAFFD